MTDSIHADRRQRRAEYFGLAESEPAEGSVSDILAAVGDDPEAAVAALETENARDKPRKTLVAGLQSVIDAGSEE